VAIRLKTAQEIEKIRRAGRVVRQVLDRMGQLALEGATTQDLEDEARRLTAASGAESLFLGVPGRGKAGPFPAYLCVSVNEELVHGIPSRRRKLAGGDIVSVDFGVRLDGWCADAAETFSVGQIRQDVKHLVDVTRGALAMAIRLVRPGGKWSQVAREMQKYVEGEGFSVVREFVGHGIGEEMWEDPKVPNFVSPELERGDIALREGLVLAVEPMVNMGSPSVEYASDGWTVLTRDRLPAAHFEHTLAVRAGGCEVLTDGR
jgi:methionyl aminopeptidase